MKISGRMLLVCLSIISFELAAADLAPFTDDADVGKVGHRGSSVAEPAQRSFVLAGSGENMWFTNDAFHFVWKRVSGDFALEAVADFLGSDGTAHRKACLMVRQSLEPDSASVDVALHGDGLTSLQFRDSPGGLTHEIQANVKRP